MFSLSIDNDTTSVQAVAKVLRAIEPAGVHLTASDAEVALAIIRDNSPDVVLMETIIGDKSGIEFAGEIRSIDPKTNIIFITDHPEYAVDAFKVRASGYLLKPVSEEDLVLEFSNLRNPVTSEDQTLIRAQCFGSFEVFRRGKIVHFSRSLSKEALAYLIDRRGAGCSVSEICSVLWEDRQADSGLKSQCRVVMGALKKDLEAIGAGDVLTKMWNTWSVDPDLISCDYYDYLNSGKASDGDFHGEYMVQYSWAELTSGVLQTERRSR